MRAAVPVQPVSATLLRHHCPLPTAVTPFYTLLQGQQVGATYNRACLTTEVNYN